MEVLAKNLGVTKGGFYRRFRDRAALLEAMLQNWSSGPHRGDRKTDQPRRRDRARTAEGADCALFRAHEYRGHVDRTGDPAMGAIRRACRQRGRQRRCGAAEECRASLPRDRAGRPRKRTRRRSCSIASCSARVCCFSNADRASARSWWRSPPRHCFAIRHRRGRNIRPRPVQRQAEPFSFFVHSL